MTSGLRNLLEIRIGGRESDRRCDFSHPTADASESKDAQATFTHLPVGSIRGAKRVPLLPIHPPAQGLTGSQSIKHDGRDVLDHRLCIGIGRMQDLDPPLTTRVLIDVVESDTGSSHRSQGWSGIKHGDVDLSRGPDHQGIRPGKQMIEFLAARSRLDHFSSL